MRFRFIQVDNFGTIIRPRLACAAAVRRQPKPLFIGTIPEILADTYLLKWRVCPRDAPMAVSCSPLRFEAELAALRGRDGVGRGQFLIGSHIQRLCDVHSSAGGRTRA